MTVNPASMEGVRNLLPGFEGQIIDSRVEGFIDDLSNPNIGVKDLISKYSGQNVVPIEIGHAICSDPLLIGKSGCFTIG